MNQTAASRTSGIPTNHGSVIPSGATFRTRASNAATQPITPNTRYTAVLRPIRRTAAARRSIPTRRSAQYVTASPATPPAAKSWDRAKLASTTRKGQAGLDPRTALEGDGAPQRAGIAGEDDDLPERADGQPADVAALERLGQVREPGLVADRHDEDDADDQGDEKAQQDRAGVS